MPPAADIVVNVDGLAEGEVLRVVGALLSASPRLRQSPRQLIVVCGDARVRTLFGLSRLDAHVLIEESLDRALPHILGRAWTHRL